MLYSIVLTLSFFAVFACVVYQEIRIRKTQNYLVLLLVVISVSSIVVTAGNVSGHALFAGIVAAMLRVVRLGGIFKTSDWLCISALFAFCVGFGIHVAVWSVGTGFATSVLHHLAVCVCTNLARGNSFEDVKAGMATRIMAAISCKKRDVFDRWAYPAVTACDDDDDDGGGSGSGGDKEEEEENSNKKTMRLEINSGIRGKKIDVSRQCPYVIPSIPVLAHMCASSLFVMTVLFP